MFSRTKCVFLAGCVGLLSLSPAHADIQIALSQSVIPAGGSVTLQVIDAFAPLPLSGLAWLQTVYPTDSQISISADDFAAIGFISYNAPGSVELAGSDSYSFSSGIGFSLPVSFTYNIPGLYKIDYNYAFTESENLIGTVLNASGDLIAGPALENPPSLEERGSGSFLVRVGSVPEPATWLMMIAGFLGLGIFSRRRNLKTQPA